MAKITLGLVESYLACHYKAFLKLTEQEMPTPDEPKSLLAKNFRASLDLVGVPHPGKVNNQTAHSVQITSSSLSKGAILILDGVIETDLVSLQIAGLRRAPGSSDIGNFHYLPCLVRNPEKAPDTLRALLDVTGFVLSRLQGRVPDAGIIWKDSEKASAVQVSLRLKRGERIMNALKEIQQADHPPTLNLNKHCQVCEFQSQCHAQAIDEDNLSLLRGISEAEMGRLRKKEFSRSTSFPIHSGQDASRSEPRTRHTLTILHCKRSLFEREKYSSMGRRS